MVQQNQKAKTHVLQRKTYLKMEETQLFEATAENTEHPGMKLHIPLNISHDIKDHYTLISIRQWWTASFKVN